MVAAGAASSSSALSAVPTPMRRTRASEFRRLAEQCAKELSLNDGQKGILESLAKKLDQMDKTDAKKDAEKKVRQLLDAQDHAARVLADLVNCGPRRWKKIKKYNQRYHYHYHFHQ